MSGHEHHSPWAEACIVKKDETLFINVASIMAFKHSFVLEFVEGKSEIKVRRRLHDKGAFTEEGSRVIQLKSSIKLGKPIEESGTPTARDTRK